MLVESNGERNGKPITVTISSDGTPTSDALIEIIRKVVRQQGGETDADRVR